MHTPDDAALSFHATIGEFLRARREEAGGADRARRLRRRTPGLRREDVAERAGISTDWYARLEQNRVGSVSDAVLERVAAALDLNEPERRYLFDLAGRARSPRRTLPLQPHPSALALMELAQDLPACIVNARGDVLCSNPLHERLMLGYGAHPVFGRNLIWFFCFDPRAEALFPDREADLDRTVANMRLALGRTAQDPDAAELLAELMRCEAFRRRWSSLRVKPRGPSVKRVNHPDAGPLVFLAHSASPPEAREQTFTFLQPCDDATRRGLDSLRAPTAVGAGSAAAPVPATASAPAPPPPWPPPG